MASARCSCSCRAWWPGFASLASMVAAVTTSQKPPHLARRAVPANLPGMKLLFFDDFRLGVLRGDSVVDVSDAIADIPHLSPQQLIRGVIERFDQYRAKLEQAAASGQAEPLEDVRVRPPLPH